MAKQTVIVSVLADTGNFQRGMKNISGGIGSALSGLGKVALGVAGVAAGITAAVGGIAIRGGISRALNIEDAQAKLRGLGYDTEQIAGVMDSALGSVRGTAFGLDSAVTTAANAMAAGVEQGAELEQYLTAVADAASIAGTGMDEMGSIFNKVEADGRLLTNEMNQLTDRGIPLLGWLADEYGVTAAEMRKMVTDGAVDAATFRQVIEDNIGGAALKGAENTRGAFANMGAAMSRFGEAIAGGVLPIAREAFTSITGMFDSLTDAVKPFAEQFWESAQNTLIPMLQNAQEAVAGFLDGMGGFDGLTGLLSPITSLMQGMSPLTLLFQTLQPIAGVLGEAFGQLAETFSGVAAEIGPMLLPMLGQLTDLLGGLIASVLPPIITIVSKLADVFLQLMPPLMDVAQVLLDGLGPALDALAPLIDLVAGVVVQLLDALAPLIGSLLEAFTPVLGSILDLLPPILGLLTDLLTPILALVGPLIDLLVPAIEFVIDVLAWLAGMIPDVLTQLFGLADGSGEIVERITGFWEPIAEWFAGLWDGITSLFGDTWDTISGLASDAWDVITTIFGTAGEIIQQLVAGAIMVIVDLFRGDFDGVRATVQKVWDNVKNLFSNATAAIRNTVSGMVGRVVDYFRNLFSRMGQATSNGIANVTGFFRNLPGTIVGFVRDLPSRFGQIGRDIIQGLINGIHNMAGWLKNAVSNVVGGVTNWAKNILGISSPSKVFAGIGRDTIAGLEQGLTSRNRLRSIMGDLAGGLEDAFDPTLAITGISQRGRTSTGQAGITINITAGVGDPIEIGRQVANALAQYRRSGGKVAFA